MRTAISSSVVGATLVLACGLAARAQDFNGNGVRDAVDLRTGASFDCNANGVPDEADVARPDFSAAVEHASDVGTTSNVSAVAAIDADLDGDMDLVVLSATTSSSSNVTLWRNDGGPGLVFWARTTIAGSGCFVVRVADMNGDGRPDVVSADASFAQVVVLLATGPGTFAPAAKYAAGSRGTGLALEDLDGDGDVDVAMAGFATNQADVWLNQGDGTLAARSSYAAGQQPSAVAAGDFTGDGLPDLAVANSYISWPGTGTVTLLRNTGSGAFAPAGTLTIDGHAETSPTSTPHDVAIEDIDGDGDGDLLVSSKDSNSLRVFTGDGAGGFANTQTIGPLESIGGAADRMACADLDGDADLELAWCDSAARAVRVYDRLGGAFVFAGSFAAGTEGPVGVVAADFTGDGTHDLAVAGWTSSAFSVMAGLGGLQYDTVRHIRRTDMGFYPVLADFTGDGVTDLASYSTFDLPSYLRIAPGLGGGAFGPARLVLLPSAGHLLPRDLNNDGHLDVLSLGNSGKFFTMLNNGDGTFGPAHFPYVIQAHGNFQTSDINGDGNLDFLWSWGVSSGLPHTIEIALGDGQGGFAPSTQVITPRFLGSVWTGDVSGDGRPELFVGLGGGAIGDPNLETFLVYPNLGDGTFGDYTVFANDLAPGFAGSVGGFAWVDIDGDGDNDLLAQSLYTWLFRNDGNQLAAPVQIAGLANYGFGVFGPTIADADEDGDLDFYGIRALGGLTTQAVFYNEGPGGAWPNQSVMRYRNSAGAVAIGDADTNGRPDILVKPEGYADWYLHLNTASSAADCNTNGEPDSCDIASGVSADANNNGVPDECEGCYADCDQSTGAGVLDFFDFVCFQDRFSAGDPYADCDQTTGVGMFDFFDFVCFQDAFASGCP